MNALNGAYHSTFAYPLSLRLHNLQEDVKGKMCDVGLIPGFHLIHFENQTKPLAFLSLSCVVVGGRPVV
jgi:hypothetical protein